MSSSILITGEGGTGKTLLARCLKQMIEAEGGKAVLQDDVFPDFNMSQTNLEPEGTITIVTVPVALPSWKRNADVVIELNSKAFTGPLMTLAHGAVSVDWGEEELHG